MSTWISDKCFANIMIKTNRKMFLKVFMEEYPKFKEQMKKIVIV